MKRWPTTPKPKAPGRQSGVALLEFTLILPMLVLMAWSVTELGRALWHYKVLAQSSREAARYLSMQTPGTGGEQARNLVLYGTLAGASAYQLSGLTAAQPVVVTATAVKGLSFATIFAVGQ